MLSFTERIESWKKVLMSPVPTLEAEAKKTGIGLKDGFENVGTSLIITYAITIILGLLLKGEFNPITIVFGLVFGIAMGVLVAIIVELVVVGLYYIMGMLLGGKTDYGRLFYMVSLPFAALTVASLVATIIGFIPFIGGIIGLLLHLAILLYGLYLLTLAIQKTYNFDLGKALIVWIVPAIILLVIVVVVFGALLIASLAAFAGLAGSKAIA